MVPAPTTPTRSILKLAPLEVRLALLEEGAHPLDAVLGGHRELVQAALVLQALAQPALVRGDHRLLGEANRDRGALGDPLGKVHRALEPVALRRHLVDEAVPLGLGGVHPPPGEYELHRPLLPEHTRQPLRSAAAGDDPERDLRLPELGGLGRDDQVTHQRELAAAAEREAGDRRSTRLNSSHDQISYAVFCLQKKNQITWSESENSETTGYPSMVAP